MEVFRLRRIRRGQVPLSVVIGGVVLLLAAAWWLNRSAEVHDGRQQIVFWGHYNLGDEIHTAIHRFEERNPQYKVVMSTPAARDVTGDAQRLLCAVAGGVPPDVVYFDRFAIGEWASRGALLDLAPYLDAQPADDPNRLDTSQYYPWALAEASFKPPGTDRRPGIFGIPQSADVRCLYINCDALRSVGLVDAQGRPRPPTDWDELRDYANKLTLYRTPGNKASGVTRLGFGPNYGNSYLYLYAWQAGGEFLNSKPLVATDFDGVQRSYPPLTRVTMDSPQVTRALRFMADVYDDLGGIGQVNAFQDTVQRDAMDAFLIGTCAMKIDSDGFVDIIATWRPGMDFIVTPAPMPADQTALGRPPVAWSGGFAWVIPATSQNKTGAFKFLQFLSSWECVELVERGKREQKEAEGRIYVPQGQGNRVFYERLVKQAVLDNPRMSESFKNAYQVFKGLYPLTYIRPVTPMGQFLWAQHVRAFEAGVNHRFRDQAAASGEDEIQLSLRTMQAEVQRQLDRLLQPPPPHVVNWTPYFWLYGAIVLSPFPLIYAVYKRRRREHGYRAREIGAAMLFVSPWFIGFVVLVLGPILFSIVYSFATYDVLNPARYVGLANYQFIVNDPIFYTSLLNTAYMLIRIPLVMTLSLSIALLLNRAVRGIGFYRAAFYLPAIMPLVVSSLLWIWLFNPTYGGINGILRWFLETAPMRGIESLIASILHRPFQFTLPLWIYDAAWSKPSLILINLWAAGGGMIIWLAGLQSIPPQLYEAAAIDGASKWKQFRHVTLPMLTPYILFNLIMGLIGTMKVFEESYIMTNGGPVDSTYFYAFYLFRQAFSFFRMGYASALAWILFVVILLLTLLHLWLSKKWVHYEQE
jgi:multiple sugar transport system permease protein